MKNKKSLNQAGFPGGGAEVFFLIPALILSLASCATAANEAPLSARDRAYESGERMIAYNVTLRLETREPESALLSLLDLTAGFDGYVITQETGSLTLRIPAPGLPGFLEQAKALGRVKSERISGRDITDAYRDDMVRLESLRLVRTRYEELLSQAQEVEDMINIEKELERVNLEIIQLEAHKQSAEQSVAYSLVSVQIDKRPIPGPLGWIFYGLYQGVRWLFVWS
ncbi:MAG: DUF4349 domain-containing protein [Spirochaetales bacterium]|nr:DUF4349 domain-containing protein [Spirochaetales bacterium]